MEKYDCWVVRMQKYVIYWSKQRGNYLTILDPIEQTKPSFDCSESYCIEVICSPVNVIPSLRNTIKQPFLWYEKEQKTIKEKRKETRRKNSRLRYKQRYEGRCASSEITQEKRHYFRRRLRNRNKTRCSLKANSLLDTRNSFSNPGRAHREASLAPAWFT